MRPAPLALFALLGCGPPSQEVGSDAAFWPGWDSPSRLGFEMQGDIVWVAGEAVRTQPFGWVPNPHDLYTIFELPEALWPPSDIIGDALVRQPDGDEGLVSAVVLMDGEVAVGGMDEDVSGYVFRLDLRFSNKGSP